MAPPALPASTGNGALDTYTQAGLSALAPGGDYTQTAAYKSIAALLGPGKDGGLSDNLMAQYKSGSRLNELSGQQQTATAISGAQGRGLGGSSIAAQGVENANFNTEMANSSLYGQLSGVQAQNTGMLAQDISAGSNAQLQDLLSIYNNAGTSAANMQMYSQGLQEALAAASMSSNAQENAGMFAGIGAIGGGLLAASDVRLKENISPVEGKPGIYRFDYKPGLGLPKGRFEGRMAHELYAEHPESVGVHKGFLTVKAPYLPRKVS